MAIQKEVNLNEPLNADVEATLNKSTLTPDLTHATITLHGDFFRQLQGRLNRHVFWHPISEVIYVTVIIVVLTTQLWDYIVISDSIGEFFYFAVKSRDFWFQFMTLFPAFVCVLGIEGLLNYIVSDQLKEISDNLIKTEYLDAAFGFDIRKFGQLEGSEKKSEDVKLLSNGQNTSVILYRESPIAALTLKPLDGKIKVTGVHVKKVFRKADFEGLLLDWAIERTREILKETNEESVELVADGYTFDLPLIQSLKIKQFKHIDSSLNLNPFMENEGNYFILLFQKIFGLRRESYSLTVGNVEVNEEIIREKQSKVKRRV